MYLRPARRDDGEAVADVARESWHAAYGDFLSTVAIDETIDEWYDPDDLREQVDHGAFWVAVDEDRDEGGETAAADTDDAHDYLSAIVFATNSVGRGFYESRGFEVVGRRTETFDGNDHEELVMRAPLEAFPVG